MAETPHHFEPFDPGRIDTQSPVELQYWSKELACSDAELADALSQVGNHVTAVRDYLESHVRRPH
ncbi:MAG TPA: DUF3606 domain-containing protein [Ramlibacter sp.]|nr:DUF3606 domain-containing protein [Ramlibacter sp.]